MGEKFIINISGNNYEVVACCEAEALRTLAKQIVKPYKPKPTLPAVPEKLNGLFKTDKRVVIAINDLIDCYSALKKVVEEKL